MKKYIAPLGLIALLLSGCSTGSEAEPAESSDQTSQASSQAPAATETPVVSEPSPLPAEATQEAEEAPALTGPGTYSFESETGATGTVAVPGDIPAELEELRQLVGGEPATFITAEVDNREGTEEFIFYELWVYDPAGEQHVYTDVSNYVSELEELIPEDAAAEVYDRFSALPDDLTGDLVQPLQVRTITLVGQAVPEEITAVEIFNGYEGFPTTIQQ